MLDNIREFVVDSTENKRTIQNGSAKIFLNRTDPYGFWHVQFERGAIPETLNQAFTTLDRAYEAIQVYFNNNASRLEQAERERVRTAKTRFEDKNKDA